MLENSCITFNLPPYFSHANHFNVPVTLGAAADREGRFIHGISAVMATVTGAGPLS